MKHLILLLLALFPASSTLSAADRPNLIFILVDDMGWSDLGCYGSEIDTPHIDSLAKSGLRLTQFYNTAKCNTSRTCLLTGLYAQQCGMLAPAKMQNARTLGEILHPAGYRTLASGKHHGRENLQDRGFDHYYGLLDGCCNFWNPGDQREGEPPPARKRVRTWCDGGPVFRHRGSTSGGDCCRDGTCHHRCRWAGCRKIIPVRPPSPGGTGDAPDLADHRQHHRSSCIRHVGMDGDGRCHGILG